MAFWKKECEVTERISRGIFQCAKDECAARQSLLNFERESYSLIVLRATAPPEEAPKLLPAPKEAPTEMSHPPRARPSWYPRWGALNAQSSGGNGSALELAREALSGLTYCKIPKSQRDKGSVDFVGSWRAFRH